MELHRLPLALLGTLAIGGCSVSAADVDPVGEETANTAVDGPGVTQKAPFDYPSTRSNVFALDELGHLRVQTNSEPWFNYWPPAQYVSLINSPAAVSWGFNRIDVFGVTTAGMLQHYGSADGGVSVYADNWGSMPGTSFDPSASCDVTTWGVGRLDVFCVGWAGDRQNIIHRWYDAATGGGWEALPALPFNGRFQTTGLAAASWGPGRLDVWLIDKNASPKLLRHVGTSSSTGRGGWVWDTWAQGDFATTASPDVVPSATAMGGHRYDIIVPERQTYSCTPSPCAYDRLRHWTYREAAPPGSNLTSELLRDAQPGSKRAAIQSFGSSFRISVLGEDCRLRTYQGSEDRYPILDAAVGCNLQKSLAGASW